MATVYCISEPIKLEQGVPVPLFDLSPALQYGPVEILLTAKQSFLDPAPLMSMLREKLANFSDEDYLLPTGDPVMIAIVGALIAEINGGFMTILKWDKRSRNYTPIKVMGHE